MKTAEPNMVPRDQFATTESEIERVGEASEDINDIIGQSEESK